MRIFEKIYGWYDRLCDKVERMDLSPLKRIGVPALFVFFSVAAVLYAVGLWDFVFIERPVNSESQLQGETPVPPVGGGDHGGGASSPDDNAQGSPADTPSVQRPSGEASFDAGPTHVPSVSELVAQGYYVTNTDYSADTHVIALLNKQLGANGNYSVNEKKVYVPEITYEYDNGEAQVEYVLATQTRPALEAYMGYLFADNGTNVIIFDSYGNYAGNYDTSYFLAYTRDLDGNPLFFKPTTYRTLTKDGKYYEDVPDKDYYVFSGGRMVESDYIDKVHSRGLHMDYPATYGVQSTDISRRCILNKVSFEDLKGNLTAWDRTLWGFFKKGEDEPFTPGWYDPEEYEAPDLDEMSEKEREEWDEAEKEAAKTRLNYAFNYSEGYAAVANEAGQMRFIDTDGEELFESVDVETYNIHGRPVVENLMLPLTDGIEALGFYYFEHGLVRVRRQVYDYYQLEDWDVKKIELDDDELIYPSGEKFTLAEGYDIISYSNGMILLEKDGRYGYMDHTGAWLVEPSLEGAKPFLEGVAAIKRNGKWGVIDTQGNTLIPYDYDNIQTVSSGVIVCYSDRGWTVFAKMTQK